MKIFILFICIWTSLSSNLVAQSISMDVVSAAGTSHVFEQGMIQWTLGEVCIETYSENSTFFTQGFHQPSDKEFINLSSIINFVQNASKCSCFSKNNEGITGYFEAFLRQR